jgi:hypothetical protein
MKKIMLALAMAGGHWLHAQSPKDSLSQKLNSIFAQVDPAKVSSGKIYDKGLALTNPLYFTSQNPISFDVSDLMPDLYYLQMGNGQEFYTQTFRKN